MSREPEERTADEVADQLPQSSSERDLPAWVDQLPEPGGQVMTEPMSAERLAEIRARAKAATEGPWFRYGDPSFEVYADPDAYPDGDSPFITHGSPSEVDAVFIRHARTDVPDLLAEVDRLRAELAASHDNRVPVELGGRVRFVDRNAVRYVEAQGDYVRLHTETGRHLLRASMGSLTRQWEASGFVRIHRRTLVNTRHVAELRRLDGGRLAVRVGGELLPVSRRQTRATRALIGQMGGAS